MIFDPAIADAFMAEQRERDPFADFFKTRPVRINALAQPDPLRPLPVGHPDRQAGGEDFRLRGRNARRAA